MFNGIRIVLDPTKPPIASTTCGLIRIDDDAGNILRHLSIISGVSMKRIISDIVRQVQDCVEFVVEDSKGEYVWVRK